MALPPEPIPRSPLPAYLSEAALDDLIQRALAEDVGPGDVTTLATVAPETQARGRLVAKEPGVVAGLYVAARVFHHVDPAIQVHWSVRDGDAVGAGAEIGTLDGPAHGLLVGERLALNLMQRMSGIATATHHLVAAVHPHPTQVLDTRKTAPGLRLLDKWAVRLGGGTNHRIGLYDLILIKDNHLAAAGGVEAAIEAARAYRAEQGLDVQIEIETRTLEEVEEVLRVGGVDIILLDNMIEMAADGRINATRLREAVQRIDGAFETEASGTITVHTAHAAAAAGVDYLSSGALTHSVRALDLSLQVTL
ncbi:MAG: carboxylating nicotinate-nucleotide diphosphorylase [Bacteroidota bacterium]